MDLVGPMGLSCEKAPFRPLQRHQKYRRQRPTQTNAPTHTHIHIFGQVVFFQEGGKFRNHRNGAPGIPNRPSWAFPHSPPATRRARWNLPRSPSAMAAGPLRFAPAPNHSVTFSSDASDIQGATSLTPCFLESLYTLINSGGSDIPVKIG